MECVNFKKRISKKTSGKLLLEKLKIIKVVSIMHVTCAKKSNFLLAIFLFENWPFQPRYNHRKGRQKFSFR